MLHIINEDGNKELKGKVFHLNDGIKKHLQNTLNNYNGDKTIDGYKRLNNLLSMKGGINYNEMKRLKNFFDNYSGSDKSIEFILNGGIPMKLWVNNTLNGATKAIHDFKQAKKEAGLKNAFIKPHDKNRQTKPKKPTQVKFKTNDITNKISTNNVLQYECKKIICISEAQAFEIKQINEAQDDMFSLQELSSIDSFKGRYEYCLQHIGKPCGKGSSRAVFQLTDDKVLKLAFNQKGIAQNEAEDDYYISVSPKIFERDDAHRWLVSEYVLPAKQQDFKECLGLSFKEFCTFIASLYYYRFKIKTYYDVWSEESLQQALEENEDLLEFDDYIGNYKPPMGDLLVIRNYGMVMRNGYPTIVLLDAGITEEIWNKYYKK